MDGIVVGGMQLSPDDPFPVPVIAADYAIEGEAKVAARLLTSLQNGTVPLKMGQAKPVFMGDTNIKVGFWGGQQGGQVLVEVSAKYDPRHLTYGFYRASKVTVEQVKAFKRLLELHGSYAFTVSCNERLLNGELDVVKYLITEREVPS